MWPPVIDERLRLTPGATGVADRGNGLAADGCDGGGTASVGGMKKCCKTLENAGVSRGVVLDKNMSLSTASLPSDFAALQAFAIALQADNQTLETTLQTRCSPRCGDLRQDAAYREAEDRNWRCCAVPASGARRRNSTATSSSLSC